MSLKIKQAQLHYASTFVFHEDSIVFIKGILNSRMCRVLKQDGTTELIPLNSFIPHFPKSGYYNIPYPKNKNTNMLSFFSRMGRKRYKESFSISNLDDVQVLKSPFSPFWSTYRNNNLFSSTNPNKVEFLFYPIYYTFEQGLDYLNCGQYGIAFTSDIAAIKFSPNQNPIALYKGLSVGFIDNDKLILSPHLKDLKQDINNQLGDIVEYG